MAKIFNIIAVDDDPNILDSLQTIVDYEFENCNLLKAATGSQAIELFNKYNINLAFIDIVLPETDGYQICQTVKSIAKNIHPYIILMSADKKGLIDRVRGFKVGAREFISKPFDLKEMEELIKSKLEWFGLQNNNEIIIKGKFSLNKKGRKICSGEKEFQLSHVEFNLLEYFFNNDEKFIPIEDIINDVWGADVTPDNVRGVISSLRAKMEDDQTNPIFMLSSKTKGYAFYSSGLEVFA